MTMKSLTNMCMSGWRDGSVFESIYCSSRGTKVEPQQACQGGSQPPVTTAVAAARLCNSTGLCRHLHSCVQNCAQTHIYITKNNKIIFQGTWTLLLIFFDPMLPLLLAPPMLKLQGNHLE